MCLTDHEVKETVMFFIYDRTSHIKGISSFGAVFPAVVCKVIQYGVVANHHLTDRLTNANDCAWINHLSKTTRSGMQSNLWLINFIVSS